MKFELELTRDNHYKFGYDGVPFTFRKSLKEKYFVKYGKCQRPVQDWRSECLQAAREIRAKTAKPLFLCFSGGLDSEVVAESLRLAAIPFQAAITRFKNGLNDHDISWAVSYCDTHQIPYQFMEIDIEDFYLGGEIWQYARPSACVFPMLTPTMKLMEWVSHRGGFPILGSADCYLVKTPQGWVAQESEPIAAMFRYQMAMKMEALAGFFVWSPELILSYLQDPTVQKLVAGEFPEMKNSAQMKHAIYSQHFPSLKPRPKYLGSEKIQKLDAQMNKKLEAEIIVGTQAFFTPYEELLLDLLCKP